MKICLIFLYAFAAAVLIFPPGALACADAGTYSISVRKPSNFEFDELKKLWKSQVKRRATLFLES